MQQEKKNYFSQNRQNFISSLEDNTVAVLFSGTAKRKSADYYYRFCPNKNFYYITGIKQEGSYLLIKKENGKAVKLSLFIKAYDPNAERWTGKKLAANDACGISGIWDINYSENFEIVLKRMLSNWKGTVSIDKDANDINGDFLISFMEDYFPDTNIKNIYSNFVSLRKRKSEYEVNMIKKAIKLTDKGIRKIYSKAKSGMYEYELEAEFLRVLAKKGIREPAFDCIVATGENFNYLHYPELDAKIKENDMILLDVGATWEGLSSDISRAFPVSGKFTAKQRTVYEIVLGCQKKAFEFIKPGIYIKDINQVCKDYAAQRLLELGIINHHDDVTKYYWHNVSHHLGLDVHDIPGRDLILEEGDVITIEPGVYIPEWNVGLRIEDNVYINKNGCDILSKEIPKDPDEIEKLIGEERK